jgi:hypothetical protein
MVEQHRLDNALQEAREIVVPADVRQLVGQQSRDVLERQSRQELHRHQDHRTEPADYRGHIHQRGDQQPHRLRCAHSRGDSFQRLPPFGLCGMRRRSQAGREAPAPQQADRKSQNPSSHRTTTAGRNRCHSASEAVHGEIVQAPDPCAFGIIRNVSGGAAAMATSAAPASA